MSHVCPTCGDEFDTKRGLNTHVGLTHDNDSYITNEELLEDLREYASEIGHTPMRVEMKEDGPHTGTIYEKRFGRWNDAVKAAGLVPNKHSNATDEDLLEELKRLANELGRTPAARHMTKSGRFAENTYLRRFGSWNGALREAGIEINEYGEVPAAELKESFDDVADGLGRAPSENEIREFGEYSPNAYKHAFGSWSNAVEELGYEVVQMRKVPSEKLKSDIQRVAQELGHTPTNQEYSKYGIHSPGAAERAFGTWSDALEESGFERNLHYSIPDGELIAEIQRVGDEVGRSPTRSEFTDNSQFTGETCENRFGSWSNALVAAGYDSVKTGPRPELPACERYGPNWHRQRKKTRKRDGFTCQGCGTTQEEHMSEYNRRLEVHHITPRREFIDGEEFDYRSANKLSNLVTFCIPCHRRYEGLPIRPVLAD